MPILDLFYRNFLIGAVYRGRARAKRARSRPKKRTIVVVFLTHSSVFYNYVKLKKKIGSGCHSASLNKGCDPNKKNC